MEFKIQFGEVMHLIKIRKTAKGQTVWLPAEFHFDSDRLEIKRFGTGLLLTPIENLQNSIKESLDSFEPNFKIERKQPAW